MLFIIFFAIKYGLLFLFVYFLWDLLRPLPQEKKLSNDTKISYKGKKLSEDDIYRARRSKRRLVLLTVVAVILPLLIASILIFNPALLEGFAFMGLLSESSLHFILFILSVFFIALTLAAILHISGCYRASSYISVAALCIYPCILFFPHFFIAHSHFKTFSPTEIHGNPPVNISTKLTLNLAGFTDDVAWSLDSSVLAVTSGYGRRVDTFDSTGHRLNGFNISNNNFDSKLIAFVNGSSQVLFPAEGVNNETAVLDVRDVTTGRIVKSITRPPQQRCRAESNNYITVSPNQKRFAITCGQKVVATFSNEPDGDWHELSNAKINPKYYMNSVQFFPDNRLIAVGGNDGYFAVVDSNTGQTLREYLAYNEPGIGDIMDGLAVSPKGDLILTGLKGVGISFEATPESLAWERSNHPIVYVWNVNDGKQVASFADKDEEIWKAAWDPKGRFVAFIESDSLVIWQPLPGKPIFTRIKLSRGSVHSLAISPNGKSLALTDEKSVTVYKIEDGQEINH